MSSSPAAGAAPAQPRASRTRRGRSLAQSELLPPPHAQSTDQVSAASSNGGDAESNPGRTRRVEVAKPRHISSPKEIRQLGRQLLIVLLNAIADDGTYVSDPFYLLPSRKAYPEYYGFIKHPISFNEIIERWQVTGSTPKRPSSRATQAEPYESFDAMRKDCELIGTNAKRFNEKGSPVYEHARQLTRLIREAYPDLVITATVSEHLQPKEIKFDPSDPDVTSKFVGDEESEDSSDEEEDQEEDHGDEEEPADGEKSDSGATPHTVAADDVRTTQSRGQKRPRPPEDDGLSGDSSRQARHLHSALRSFVRHLHEGQRPDGSKIADMFETLPSQARYPDYYRRIKSPISLHEIEDKISRRLYDSGWSLVQDLNTMTENALVYNQKGSLIWFDAYWIRYIIKMRAIPAFLSEGFTFEKGDAKQVTQPEERSADASYGLRKGSLSLPPLSEWLPEEFHSFPLPPQYAPRPNRVPNVLNSSTPTLTSSMRASLPPRTLDSSRTPRTPAVLKADSAAVQSSPYSLSIPNRLPPAPASSTPLRSGTTYGALPTPMLRNGGGAVAPQSQAPPRPGAIPMGMSYQARSPLGQPGAGTKVSYPAPSQLNEPPKRAQPPARAQSMDKASPEWWLGRINPFAQWDHRLTKALDHAALDGSNENAERAKELENVIPYFLLEFTWRPPGPLPAHVNGRREQIREAENGEAEGTPAGCVRQQLVLCNNVTRQHLVQLGPPEHGKGSMDLVQIRVHFFLRDLVARQRWVESGRPTNGDAPAQTATANGKSKPSTRQRLRPKSAPSANADKPDARDQPEHYSVSTYWDGKSVPASQSVLTLSEEVAPKAAQSDLTAYHLSLTPGWSTGSHTLEVNVSNVPRLLAVPTRASMESENEASGRPRRARVRKDPPAPLPGPEGNSVAPANEGDANRDPSLASDAKQLLSLMPERYRLFLHL